MSVPKSIEAKLSDVLWLRKSNSGIADAITELGVPIESDFATFYTKYSGPFGNDLTGAELLDIIEQAECVLTSTRTVRVEFRFPNRFLVVSAYHGGSVLVYDVVSEKVYDVDFEGGDQLLLEGKLNPVFNSWNDFLLNYFR